MSLLAPLYFLGGLAIGLPVLFHLIRRQPQGEVPFSSLMFLRPTPPRLTRRSRLENWPLLLIRALVIALLAAAFARPLFRSVELADVPQTRTAAVLLVDTSASMRRTGLWEQAVQHATEAIDALQTGDQLAVVNFDIRPQLKISFERSKRTDVDQLKSAATNELNQLSPTWYPTDLGRAIRFASELATSRDDKQSEAINKVILVSDMSEGSKVESLQAYAWPEDVALEIRRVTVARSTNASPTLLADPNWVSDVRDEVRVRVENSADSTDSSFRLGWDRPGAEEIRLPVQVPPGQSRVVRLPRPDSDVRSLTLVGDDHDFDNQRYYVVPDSKAISLIHVGAEPPDPRDSLVHYLKQAPLGDRYRTVTIESVDPAALVPPENVDATPLVVIEQAFSDELASEFGGYLNAGGRMLAVLADAESAGSVIETCNAITGAQFSVGESIGGEYAMLSKIEFGHPIFAPLSDPPFNDFSKIRFWSHRSLVGVPEDWSVLASFDDGSPALLELAVGEGRFWILTAGWQPSASQLALSTKFVPLLFRFVDAQQAVVRGDTLTIGDAIPFLPSPTAKIENSIGESSDYRVAADLQAIDRPGVYRWIDQDEQATFAVNLPLNESRTVPVTNDALEQFGVQLDVDRSDHPTEASRRQLLDRELEGRQRIWQWLLAAALALIGLETWLGSRVGRNQIGGQTNEPSTV